MKVFLQRQNISVYKKKHEKTGEITWQDISKKLTNKSESFKNNKYSTGKRAVEYVERIREFQEVLRYYASK